MKTNFRLCLLLVLTLMATAYIFGNSLKDGAESHESSDKIVEIVEPVVKPIAEKLPGDKGPSFWVRKAAHVIEFFVLGLCAMALGLALKHRFGPSFLGYVLFYVLLTAVTDEFIQSFTGRTSSVKDVFIDLGGAVLGIAVAGAVRAVKARKQQ